MSAKLWCFTVALQLLQVFAATPHEWRSRSIYQVLTDRYARTDGNNSAKCLTAERLYCGGTYRGLVDNLDYIQDMGFSAVWISPVTYNLEENTGWGEAYHGYWQQELFRLNEHFGTADDLKYLSSELHRRGMYLMVDIVVNHNAWPGPPDGIDYSRFHPFNDSSYYHPFCEVTNYNDQSLVENCWLGDTKVLLVDVKTEDPRVISTYNSWISSLVSNYSIDGLRIDTAKHVQKWFWPGFNKAAGVFCTGEVLSGDPDYTLDYLNDLDSVLNYPIYYPLTRAFTSKSGNMSELIDMHNVIRDNRHDTTLLLNFASNHDVPRLAALSSSLALTSNALAYTLLSDGIPTLYQGDEHRFSGFEDPDNREALWLSGFDTNAPLYRMVRTLNKLRSWAGQRNPRYWTSRSLIFWSDRRTLAMRKGAGSNQVVTMLTNLGERQGAETTRVTNTGFMPGTIVMDVIACEEFVVRRDGVLIVDISGGAPKVFYPLHLLAGSTICESQTRRELSFQGGMNAWPFISDRP